MERITIDRYVVDTLMRDLVGHDRQPTAFLVYLWLWMEAAGAPTGTVAASLRALAAGTGLSRRAVQDAVARLHRRKLIEVERSGITSVPVYKVCRPWLPPRRGRSA